MIMTWIRGNLGPLAVIMDFFAAHPEILTAILALWMLIYAIGHIQVKMIESRTARLVIERCRLLMAADPQLSLAELREKILPAWLEEYKNWSFYFVPHKYDFWPVPATPKNVLVKLPLSNEWLARVLKRDGIILPSAVAEAPIKSAK